MGFVCSWVFLVSSQQTTAVFVTSPKPVVVKLLRGFKNGSRLHSGSRAVVPAGRTGQTVAPWRPGLTPPQRVRGLGGVQIHWCSNSLNKGLNALVETLEMCLGHLKFCQDATCQVILCRNSWNRDTPQPPAGMHFNFSVPVSCPVKYCYYCYYPWCSCISCFFFFFPVWELGSNFLARDTRTKLPTCNWHFAKLSSSS